MNSIQLQLFSMWDACPLCGEQNGPLGQWSPLSDLQLCRACTATWPYPIDVLEYDPKGKDLSKLRVRPDAPFEEREARMWADDIARQIKKGVMDDRAITKYNLGGRQLRNGIRRSKHEQYQRWGDVAEKKVRYQQFIVPLCQRCGCAHDERSFDNHYRSHCKRCNDELGVEAFWGMKGIFGGDDDEAILDRIQKSHPEWFKEGGVMPDYWFGLKLKAALEEKEKQP